MKRGALMLACFFALSAAGGVWAQLPPDAVMLDKVKITEAQKSTDLCPVYLTESAEDGPEWTYKGVAYRGAKADAEEKFMADPDAFAAKALEQRYVNNFVEAMSIIWCPVTDEVNPGGLAAWTVEGIKWESCCEFCETSVRDDDFEMGLERLLERANQSFKLTGGKYSEGHSSPVEGAIKMPTFGAPAEAAQEHGDQCAAEPEWMAGKTLEATYSGGIGLIFENRCMECHSGSGPAPMSFKSLGEIKKWSKGLKVSVTSRAMPPWTADANVSTFANSRMLSQKEIDLIVEWANAGYAPGDGEFKSARAGNDGWTIGKPDHVFKIPEYTIGEDVEAEIAEFEIKTDFAEDRWIVASQVRPGNDFDTRYIDAGPLGVYQQGIYGEEHPAGYAQLLKAGETIKVRAYYAKEKGWESMDPGSEIGVIFAEDASGLKNIESMTIANNDFTIPAGEANQEVTISYKLDNNVHIVSILPVLEARGKNVNYSATTPDGVKHELLSIPNWDPAWKMRYQLCEPLAAPKGTVIEVTAHYDNSKLNIRNPNPDAEVKAGPGGELLEGWIGYTTD